MLDSALYYASLGWPIFPCRPREKIPMTVHGCKDATTDEATIKAWWQRWPDANIGLHCDGVYVVDIDYHPDKAIDGWQSLEEEFREDLPMTVRQDTPTGGAHFLYSAETAPANKNSFRKGIDIRGEGYYILLAPSVHPNGGTYKFRENKDPSTLPLTIFPDFMRPEQEKVIPPWQQKKPPKRRNKNAQKHIQKETVSQNVFDRAARYLQECEPAVQGNAGHDSLLWAANAMVNGFQLNRDNALELLKREFNPRCQPPWDMSNKQDARDFSRKVDEAIKQGSQKPAGWLLEEYGLQGDDIDKKKQEFGAEIAENLIEAEKKKHEKQHTETTQQEEKESTTEVSDNEAPECPPKRADEEFPYPPGFVGDIAKWFDDTSRKKQPLLSLGGALAFGSAIVGRKVRDEWDLRTNIYCLGIAPTCAGKEHHRSQIKRLLEEAGERDKILGGEDVTSDAAIETGLYFRPACLYLWDEIGHFIANIKTAQSQTHLRTILPTLMKLYTSANSTYVGKEYADGSRQDVVQPCVSLYGTTVPHVLYAGITSDELRDGFLGRVLPFITNEDPEPDDSRARAQDVPEHLIQQVQAWIERRIPPPEGKGDIQGATGVYQITIPTQSDAQQRFLNFRKYVRKRKEEAKEKADGTDALWGRAEEQARKIALTLAALERFDNAEITDEHAIWAIWIVDYCLRLLIQKIEESVADNQIEADKKEILNIVKSNGKKGIKQREFTRRTQKFSKRQREEYLQDLRESNQVVKAPDGASFRYYPYPYGLGEQKKEEKE